MPFPLFTPPLAIKVKDRDRIVIARFGHYCAHSSKELEQYPRHKRLQYMQSWHVVERRFKRHGFVLAQATPIILRSNAKERRHFDQSLMNVLLENFALTETTFKFFKFAFSTNVEWLDNELNEYFYFTMINWSISCKLQNHIINYSSLSLQLYITNPQNTKHS